MLFEATNPEVVVSGPAGTGKSRACLERVVALSRQYRQSRALIIRKTRESLTESGLVTLEQYVLGADHPSVINGPQRRNRQGYVLENGSQIVVGGLDRPSKVMSTEYDLIYVQEAIELTENDWESLTTRLRNGRMPLQQLLADTNPDRPTHWLKQRSNTGKTRMIESRHSDNPVLWNGKGWTARGKTYIAKLNALTGPRKARLAEGRWVQADGVVYPEYDAAVHLIDRFDIPPDWRRFRAIDFGFTNPFVCQWWAIDPDGRMYLYREMYMSKRIVEDHAPQIVALSEGERIEASVADHDAEDRATLERHGIHTLPAEKEVGVGIQAVQARLRKAGDDRPRLYLLRDSLVETDDELAESKQPLCTENEIDGYVWAKPQAGKASKEEPLKVDDHGMDALRYAVKYADKFSSGGAFW